MSDRRAASLVLRQRGSKRERLGQRLSRSSYSHGEIFLLLMSASTPQRDQGEACAGVGYVPIADLDASTNKRMRCTIHCITTERLAPSMPHVLAR